MTPHFGGRPRVVELEELEGGYQGHGGGDWGLVQALYDDILTVSSPADMTTSIEESAHSHVMALPRNTPPEREGGGRGRV